MPYTVHYKSTGARSFWSKRWQKSQVNIFGLHIYYGLLMKDLHRKTDDYTFDFELIIDFASFFRRTARLWVFQMIDALAYM